MTSSNENESIERYCLLTRMLCSPKLSGMKEEEENETNLDLFLSREHIERLHRMMERELDHLKAEINQLQSSIEEFTIINQQLSQRIDAIDVDEEQVVALTRTLEECQSQYDHIMNIVKALSDAENRKPPIKPSLQTSISANTSQKENFLQIPFVSRSTKEIGRNKRSKSFQSFTRKLFVLFLTRSKRLTNPKDIDNT
ncbi:hypothetical protein SNEBB_008396 [Seison nebaliae]|nr:hypothetical protein SNEBB_008396 [Seison nebaliae]